MSMHNTSRHTFHFPTVLSVAALAVCHAHADIIDLDDTHFDFSAARFQGFEGYQAGAPVQQLMFGDISATVTFGNTSPLYNQIIQGGDGLGVVAHEGDNTWRLSANMVQIDFGDARLSQFGFYYSDLEWSSLKLTFGAVGSTTLEDWNSYNSAFFAYTTAPGHAFGSVTMEWSDDTDGVGFDNMFVALVPAPGAVAMVAIAGGLPLLRRKRPAA
jgi:hypothetical protein